MPDNHQPDDDTTPIRRILRLLPGWVTDPSTLAGAGLVAAMLAALSGTLLVLILVWKLLGAVLSGIGHAAAVAVDLSQDSPLIKVSADPIHTYITDHAGALPASADDLQMLWIVTGATLFFLGTFGSWAGRAGFLVHGALTGFMVWSSTPATGRYLAVGVTVLIWCVLSCSVFAFAFRPRGPHTIVIPQPIAGSTGNGEEDEEDPIDRHFHQILA